MRAGQGRQSRGDPRRRYCIFKSIFASFSSSERWHIPDKQWRLLGDSSTDGLDNLKVQPDAVLEAASVLVCTVVADRARKLV